MRRAIHGRVAPALGTLFLLLLIAAAAMAQRGRRFREPDDEESVAPPRAAEFHFLRVEYTDLP